MIHPYRAPIIHVNNGQNMSAIDLKVGDRFEWSGRTGVNTLLNKRSLSHSVELTFSVSGTLSKVSVPAFTTVWKV